MNSKVTSFILGFLLFGAAMLVVILVVARPAKIEITEPDDTLSSDDLQKAQQVSNGLENYGNLPFDITGDQIGRSNPFESY